MLSDKKINSFFVAPTEARQRRAKWGLITLGTVIWSATTVKSGLVYAFGMGFWGPHGHDGVWHISLIQSLARGSFDMPIFAGESIKNYHLGFDLFVAALHRLTTIPVSYLYFQILPPIFAFLIGWLTYKFVIEWTRSAVSAWWAAFFVYFGGSLGWIVGRGESAFWSQQAVSTLINPPFALSLVLLLILLLLLQRQRYILAGLVLAVLPQVKIYAGVLAFAGLGLAAFKNHRLLKTLLLGLLISLPVNLQLITRNQQLINWRPGWFLETMMSFSDRLGWTRFFSAMTNHLQAGNLPQAFLFYSGALAIFTFGNLGTRIIALIFSPRGWPNADFHPRGGVAPAAHPGGDSNWRKIFFISVIAAGGLIPMFFLQSGTPWNTIQFFYYTLFCTAILAGVSLGEIIGKIKSRLFVTAVSLTVILFTIPTTYDTLTKVYLPSRPPAKISLQELSALQFLARQPRGTVLVPAANPNPYAPPPRPLYLYESTAYVSAFSAQPVFLEDEVNLNITGYDWPTRRRAVDQFFTTRDPAAAQKFLAENHIKYLYLPEVATVRPVLSETDLGLTKLYENSTTAIWGTSN